MKANTKYIGRGLASLGLAGILTAVFLSFAAIGISVYGIVLAFSASVVFGIITLLVEPLPFLIGIVKLVAHIDLAHRIVEFFTK